MSFCGGARLRIEGQARPIDWFRKLYDDSIRLIEPNIG
jgi:hypothetical protein